jgi:hypothetical protein
MRMKEKRRRAEEGIGADRCCLDPILRVLCVEVPWFVKTECNRR